MRSEIEKNKLASHAFTIVKGLIVAYISFLGISFGGTILLNLKLPEILSQWSLENPIYYLLIFIPVMTIISIILSQKSKQFSKNTIFQFLYMFLILLSLLSLVDIVEQFILAERIVLSSFITIIILNIFPALFGAIGIKVLWRKGFKGYNLKGRI